MKTTLALGAEGMPFAGEGTLHVPARASQEIWPLIDRVFAALEQLHAAGGFGRSEGAARIRWLDDGARTVGESARRWRVEVHDVPGVFWRVLVRMLQARGVQALELVTDAARPGSPRNPPRSWLDAALPPPTDLAFEVQADDDPKDRPDRFVRLEFSGELDPAGADVVSGLLKQWHEALWGGFDDPSGPMGLPPGASAYQLDPCTVVSRIDGWSSTDEAWAVLLHLGRHVDRTVAAVRSIVIE